MLPPLKVGQILDLDNMLSKQGFSRPPARYTEASLVKKLEEMGIGRPSTMRLPLPLYKKENMLLRNPVKEENGFPKRFYLKW